MLYKEDEVKEGGGAGRGLWGRENNIKRIMLWGCFD